MKSDTYNSLGIEFTVNGLPSSVEEYDEMAQRQGACLDSAIGQFIAHTHLTKVRSALVAAVEKITGIEREKKEEDGKTSFTETEKTYLDRVESEHLQPEGKSLYEGDIYTKLQAAAAAVEVDLTKQTRVGASSKLAQKWLDMAGEIVKAGKADAFAAKYGLTYTGEEEEDLKILGACIKEQDARIRREAQARLMEL